MVWGAVEGTSWILEITGVWNHVLHAQESRISGIQAWNFRRIEISSIAQIVEATVLAAAIVCSRKANSQVFQLP